MRENTCPSGGLGARLCRGKQLKWEAKPRELTLGLRFQVRLRRDIIHIKDWRCGGGMATPGTQETLGCPLTSPLSPGWLLTQTCLFMPGIRLPLDPQQKWRAAGSGDALPSAPLGWTSRLCRRGWGQSVIGNWVRGPGSRENQRILG